MCASSHQACGHHIEHVGPHFKADAGFPLRSRGDPPCETERNGDDGSHLLPKENSHKNDRQESNHRWNRRRDKKNHQNRDDSQYDQSSGRGEEDDSVSNSDQKGDLNESRSHCETGGEGNEKGRSKNEILHCHTGKKIK